MNDAGLPIARHEKPIRSARTAAELEEAVRITDERARYFAARKAAWEGGQSAVERNRALQKARDADRALAFLVESSPLGPVSP